MGSSWRNKGIKEGLAAFGQKLLVSVRETKKLPLEMVSNHQQGTLTLEALCPLGGVGESSDEVKRLLS